MAATAAKTGILRRLDRLNEFERQPVAEDRLHGGMYFAGSFAGEHVAATEFVIGALFVVWGATAFDVLVGLLLGNLLAVLSWVFVCAPIAVSTRLTLYWYLRRIAGPVVMVIYNVLNAVLYCILAGCMITVAASAVRIPFGIKPQTGWLPTDPWFVPVVIVVGAAVVTLAILGFKRLAQFASVCSPWMLLMFVAGALVLLPRVGVVGRFSRFWTVANERVWAASPPVYKSMTKQRDRIILEFENVQGGLFAVGGGPPKGFTIAGEDGRFVEARATFDGPQMPATPVDGPPEEASDAPARAEIDAQFPGVRVVVWSPAVKDPIAVDYTWPAESTGALLNADAMPVASFRTDQAAAASRIGFWHIAAFAWICNLAMHLGLSDMALFRYARRFTYGFYSAFGMYLGHYVAWICAGIMGAAAAKLSLTPLVYLDSGEVAFAALGWAGALAVVIAGWTTSNPTLYRAGLALQVVTPGWPRWFVTLVAGVITTAIACFPFVFQQLLRFVAIYGIMLMPVGAIVVAEHWIFPRIGLTRFWSARKRQKINWAALISWGVGLAFAATCWALKYYWEREILHEFFLVIPVWILTVVLYIVLAALFGAREPLPELPEERPPAAPGPAADRKPPAVSRSRVYLYFGGLALMCLLSILFFSYCIFAGFLKQDAVMLRIVGYDIGFRDYLVIATVVYFVSGAIWMHGREKRKAQPAG